MSICRAQATTYRVKVCMNGLTCAGCVHRNRRGPDGTQASQRSPCLLGYDRGGTSKGPASRCVRWPQRQHRKVGAETARYQRHVVSYNPKHRTAPPPKEPTNTKTPALRGKRGGYARRRRDLNPRGAMHPYLLSREAHSTGLCDVSSADYFRAFSPRARTCARRDARGRSTRRRARDSNPRCHC